MSLLASISTNCFWKVLHDYNCLAWINQTGWVSCCQGFMEGGGQNIHEARPQLCGWIFSVRPNKSFVFWQL